MVGTRNLLPSPDSINKEIDHQLNILATFAFPDPQERNEEIGKVVVKVKAAQEEMKALIQRPNPTPPIP